MTMNLPSSELRRRTPQRMPAEVIPRLRQRLIELDSTNLDTDDATLILATITESPVRWRDNWLALWRLVCPVHDATQLQM